MSSKCSRSSRSSALGPNTKPVTFSSKDAAFEQELIDNGVYPPGYDNVEPDNLEEIVEKLGQRRASLSPSNLSRDDFLLFRRRNDEATTEAEVMMHVFPMITGNTNIPSGSNQMFKNLKPLGDRISTPQPDYFNGSRTKEIRPKVRDDLGQYIIPSSQRKRPALPNFFMEAKGPEGKSSVAKRQITQDLAAGARGMLRMQSYGLDDPVFDNKAYTFGSIYDSGSSTLQLFAMHPTKPGDADGKPEYHTTKIRGFDLTDNLDTHRQGIGAFRNLRDLATEWRAEFIAAANETADNDDEPGVASVDTYLTSFVSISQPTQTELLTADSYHEEPDSTSADELVILATLKQRPKARQRGK